MLAAKQVSGARGPMKRLSLLLLVVQSCSAVLMLKYSRSLPGRMYLGSTVVLLTEVVKLSLCLCLECLAHGYGGLCANLRHHLLERGDETLKLLVPAALFAVQNNINLVAISNLDAFTYQVTYQLKILTTAMFSVLLLGKRLHVRQWAALACLLAGVATVQIESTQSEQHAGLGASGNPLLGLTMVLLASLSSGFAGVYFERLLKDRAGSRPEKDPFGVSAGHGRASIWMRNIQLGLFGLVLSAAAMVVYQGAEVAENGFFYGYSWLVLGIVFIQAVGGLLVSLVIAHADNVLKVLSTSLSIVLSSWLSHVVFGTRLTPKMCVGCALVLLSIAMYSAPVATNGPHAKPPKDCC